MPSKRSADTVDGNTEVDDSQNHARPRKKLRAFTEEDVKLAKIYDGLASDEEDERLKAAVEMVRAYGVLRGVSKEVEGEAEVEAREARVQKIHVRLLRGLCSNRKGARIGFSLALTEVLRLKFGGSTKLAEEVGSYLAFVEEHTRPDNYATAQEKRNHLIGRVFAYSSLVQSKVLSDASDDGQSLSKCIAATCVLSQQVSWPWLKEECGLVCYQAVRLLCENKPQSKAVERVLEVLQAQKSLKTPEGVVIWLEISSKAPEVSLPGGVWHKNDPLSGKELPNLAKILHAIKMDEEDKSTSGSRVKSPHFAWGLIFRELMDRDQKSSGGGSAPSYKGGYFKQFWIEAVDNVFFAPSASPERKALGFQIFENIMSSGTGVSLATAFSPKLMKCLINQSAQPGRYLHVAAKGLLEAMVRRARSEQAVGPVIFAALVSGNGDINFDRLTKSNIVQSLITNADDAALTAILDTYFNLIARPPADKQQNVDAFRQVAADQIMSYVRSRKVTEKDIESGLPTWLSKVFTLFIQCGYLISRKGKGHMVFSPEPSTKAQEMFRARLASCLTHLMASDSTKLLQLTVAQLAAYDINAIATLSDSDAGVQAAITNATTLLTATSPETLSNEPQLRRNRAFKTLLTTALFQAYSGEADALTMLTELLECLDDLNNPDREKQNHALNALFEVILSFCSQESALNRKLSEHAFLALCPDLTQEGMQSLLDVLGQKEGVAGQDALFSTGGEDEGEEDGEDGEGGSDEEDVEAEEGASESEEDGSENEEDSADSDVEAIDGNPIPEEVDASDAESASSELLAFEEKLATALRTSLPNTINDNNADSDSDAASTTTSSTMSDNAMLALDSTLSTIFRQRLGPQNPNNNDPNNPTNAVADRHKTKKATHRAARTNMIHFKTRVLALLSLYLKHQHTNPLSLRTVLPLLQLIRNTRAAAVSGSAGKVLLDVYFAGAKKRGLPVSDPGSGGDNGDEAAKLWELLQDCHAEMLNWASKEHARCGSRAVLFLARCLGKLEAEGGRETLLNKITTLYTTAKTNLEAQEKQGEGKGGGGWKALGEWQKAVWREWGEFSLGFGGGGGVVGGDARTEKMDEEKREGKKEGKKGIKEGKSREKGVGEGKEKGRVGMADREEAAKKESKNDKRSRGQRNGRGKKAGRL